MLMPMQSPMFIVMCSKHALLCDCRQGASAHYMHARGYSQVLTAIAVHELERSDQPPDLALCQRAVSRALVMAGGDIGCGPGGRLGLWQGPGSRELYEKYDASNVAKQVEMAWARRAQVEQDKARCGWSGWPYGAEGGTGADVVVREPGYEMPAGNPLAFIRRKLMARPDSPM